VADGGRAVGAGGVVGAFGHGERPVGQVEQNAAGLVAVGVAGYRVPGEAAGAGAGLDQVQRGQVRSGLAGMPKPGSRSAR
jgi:hypothetical protein